MHTRHNHTIHLDTKTLILSIHQHQQSYTSHKSNRKHNIHHIPYTNIDHISTPTAKPLSSATAATQPTFSNTTHSHYKRHKTSMLHIYIYIYIDCLYASIGTRGNNKMLHVHNSTPHVSSEEKRVWDELDEKKQKEIPIITTINIRHNTCP